MHLLRGVSDSFPYAFFLEKFQILCLLFPSAHRIVVPKSGTILDETSIARIEQMKVKIKINNNNNKKKIEIENE